MPTILLVDDDVQLLSSLAERLEEAGYSVLRASRLDVAGRMLMADLVDLVLLEVAAEHGQGWEFLREAVELRGVPVVVLSSHGHEEDVVAALDLGALDFLTKPFRGRELEARLRARLGARAPEPRGEAVGEYAPAVVAPRRDASARTDEIDSPLFIDTASEHALLQERLAAEAYEGDIEELPLSERLRTARHQLKLSLVQIELDTKLRIWYIQAMEEGRFGMLPRGMAEQMLRTYASYLGLDVDHALSDFRREYSDLPVQPLAHLGGRPVASDLPQWPIVAAAAVLALIIGLGGIWLLAPEQVGALGSNLRTLVSAPTATPTPSPTRPPTVTPTTVLTPTATSTAVPTRTPVPTPIPATPTEVPAPTP